MEYFPNRISGSRRNIFEINAMGKRIKKKISVSKIFGKMKPMILANFIHAQVIFILSQGIKIPIASIVNEAHKAQYQWLRINNAKHPILKISMVDMVLSRGAFSGYNMLE